MYSKNIQNIVGMILIAIAAISSSVFASASTTGGSIMVYNNSLYKIKVIVTTQTAAQAAANPTTTGMSALLFDAAPMNADGTLVVHPTDTNYLTGSNVPQGTVSEVKFTDPAKDFDIAIMDATGTNILTTINVGKTLGTVVDNDPARAVYIYSNVDSASNPVANSGGVVYFWDAAHLLTTPSQQSFTTTTTV